MSGRVGGLGSCFPDVTRVIHAGHAPIEFMQEFPPQARAVSKCPSSYSRRMTPTTTRIVGLRLSCACSQSLGTEQRAISPALTTVSKPATTLLPARNGTRARTESMGLEHRSGPLFQEAAQRQVSLIFTFP